MLSSSPTAARLKRDRADRSFDGVVIELDVAVIEEARQAFSARQGVADGLGQFALLADQAKLGAEPGLERVNQRAASLLSGGATLVGTAAADCFLDDAERGDTVKRFVGDRRRPGRCKFIEAPPDMRPAERQPDVARIGQLAVAGIAVDLQADRIDAPSR